MLWAVLNTYMTDSYGRKIEYLRISVTDRCNLRCRYCMPNGVDLISMKDILSFEEIVEVAKAAASIGISRLKVTGGEPLVRIGCTDLIAQLKAVDGIEEVTLTTNGILLSKYLDDLLRAGTDAVNISLDTLDKEKYRAITGFDQLENVLQSIDDCLSRGVHLKINCVLQQGLNDDEWPDLIMLAKDNRLDVRFIEIMPIGQGALFNPISNDDILCRMMKRFPGIEEDDRKHGNGPAKYVSIPGFTGGVGFISALHGKFCSSCNRLRMTAVGELKPCLCFGDTIDLREILRSKDDPERHQLLKDTLTKAIMSKPESHCFEDRSLITENKRMISIGG